MLLLPFVSVIKKAHPHGRAGAGRLQDWSASADAFVNAAWRGRLHRDYGGGPPGDAPYDLLPAAVSTYGAWHPAFVRWIRRLLRDRAAASAEHEAEASELLGGMLWRVAALLSVGVQRAVFQGIAHCLPELRAGSGRLGRPLSEEPEFWRAIPDAECVDWVAEELGLEPGRWDWPRGGFGGDLARGGVGGARRPVRRAAAGAGELEVAPSSAAPPEGQGYADWLLLNRPFVNAPPRNEVGSRQQAPPTSAALADPRGRAALHALSLMQRGPGVQGEPADQVRRSG